MLKSIAEIREHLKRIILETNTDLNEGQDLSDDTTLAGKGAAIDSVALLETVLRIENEFGILLDDDSLMMQNFQTIDALAELIQSKLTALPKA